MPTNTLFYWRVRSRDANHTAAQDPSSAWSSSDSFAFADGTPPAISLISPVNGFGIEDVFSGGVSNQTFSWSASPPAAQYRVSISTDPTFATLTYDSGWISANQWSQAIAAGGCEEGVDYYWKVQGKAIGSSEVTNSATRTFWLYDWCY